MISVVRSTTGAAALVGAALLTSACSAAVGVGDGARSRRTAWSRTSAGPCWTRPASGSTAWRAPSRCSARTTRTSTERRRTTGSRSACGTGSSSSGSKPELRATTNGSSTEDEPLALSAARLIPVVTEKYQSIRPFPVGNLSCFPLRARVGATSQCVGAFGDQGEPHLVTLTATAVEGRHVDFDIDVASEPLR